MPFFENPVRHGAKIFWFYDIVHIIKNCRTHLLNQGFLLQSGVTINKAIFESLIQKLGNSDVRMAYKITPELINVRDQDAQRVHLATKLLSKTTSDALIHLFPNNPLMLECAKFIRKADGWFDVFNSNQKYDIKDEKCAYEIHLDHQTQVIQEFANEVANLKVYTGKGNNVTRALQPWKHGVLIATKGLPLLFEYLKESYDITYLLSLIHI